MKLLRNRIRFSMCFIKGYRDLQFRRKLLASTNKLLIKAMKNYKTGNTFSASKLEEIIRNLIHIKAELEVRLEKFKGI